MDGHTVIALSTPPGESGLAVVRMSGPEAAGILASMAPESAGWQTHTAHRTCLKNSKGEILDDVVAIVMRAPNSFTGEDVVEISCHGSMHITSEIIEEAVTLGARPAGKGEFTRRAFLEGKLDLAQAEAVADLISAETRLQSRVALEHLGGRLSRMVGEVEKIILDQMALVEISIDFSEEDVETWNRSELAGALEEAAGKLRHLSESEIAGRKLRNGIRVTIIGPRNAGKSSLYNALIGEERAIVSPTPGTTRDILRERIHIGGFTYYLEDTAGMAETGCEIEAAGISMGRKAAKDADLVLLVIDGSREWQERPGEEIARMSSRAHLAVLNKADLGLAQKPEEVGAMLGLEHGVAVSALKGEGLDELREWIFKSTIDTDLSEIRTERVAVNARQGGALREAIGALERAAAELEGEAAAEIISLELREAADACGRVTGRSVAEDLLDTIFSNFCIGK